MQSFEDMGYKSDGEGYQHQPHQNQQAGQGSHNNSRGAKCYNPNRSCENVMYNNGGKSSNSSQFHSMRNGYASDGEGYAIRNRRVSRSGKYGSHGSSPVAHHMGHHGGQGGQDNKHHHHHHRSQQHQQQVNNTFIFYLFTIDLTKMRMV